jgi:GT2 family glycosyltransferase
MSISVVIANYQGEQLLPECLASLERQTMPPVEVIVVDVGSSDRSTDVAQEYGAVVVEADNRGVGPAYNTGAGIARGELVLCSNNDVAYDDDCLELLAAALGADPSRFAADPCQLDWDGRRVIHAQTRLHTAGLLGQPLPGLLVDHVVHAETTVPTVAANGAAMLVRRDRLSELGGFDKTFFMEYEELDLCWRAWLRGWETVYVPSARVRHRVAASTSEANALPARVASAHHNMTRFALKCLPRRAAARVVVGQALRCAAHPRMVGPALARVICELPEILAERRALRPDPRLYEWFLGGQRRARP